MATNNYELLLIAVPTGSDAEERIYEFVSRHKCLALGMSIDLENDTEKELEELMTTIIAEGGSKYGLQAE